MNIIQTKQQKILVDTICHFNLRNRAWDNVTKACTYSHKANGGCAIGRLLLAAEAEMMPTGALNIEHMKLPYMKKLKPLGFAFLRSLQCLHDDPSFWDADGLSKLGQGRVSALCREFKLDPIDFNLNISKEK